MNPTSIAVVGASQRRSRATSVLLNLKRTGYAGPVYAVNPRYHEVEGYPCVPSVSAAPAPVDCVVVAIPAAAVPGVLEDAFEVGARAAVVLSSGFGEGGHDDGERVSRLRDLASRGMRICGPNCYGILNVRSGAAAFSGGLPDDLLAGPVSVVSQSGGMSMNVATPLMERFGIGCGHVVSCGNQLGVSIEEYLDYLVDDEGTGVIAVYAEGFRDPERLAAVAERARERDTAIVVLKGGRTEAGRLAALSHTGSLSGSTEILSSLLRRHGCVQVRSLDQLIDTVAMLTVVRGRLRPLSRNVVVVTGGGGEGTHAADAAEAAGVGLPELADATKRSLSGLLPEFGAARNPVDGTGTMYEDPALFPALLDVVLSDPQDGVIAVNMGGGLSPRPGRPDFGAALIERAERAGRLMIAYSGSALGRPPDVEAVMALERAGVPFVAGTEHLMAAIGSLHEYQRFRACHPRPEALSPGSIAPARTLPGGVLPFLQARELLAEFGIPVAPAELAACVEEAVAVADRLGYPVALKVEARGLTHKSDVGGVVLGCADAAAVASAFRTIRDNVREAAVDNVDGVLVQAMSRPGIETIAGITVDPVLGAGIVFGLGGVLVEVLHDVVTEVPPLSVELAGEMMRGIRSRAVLDGVRGGRPADVDALARVLVGLGALAVAYRHRLVAVDVNPLIVGPVGQGAVAVDAVVELRDQWRA